MIRPELLPTSPYGSSHFPLKLLEESGDFRPLQITPSTTIGYTLLNEHLMGAVSPVISIGGIGSDIQPDRAFEGVQLATLQRPIIMLDMPGHGLSSPCSPKQIIDLCIKRDTTSQTEPLVDAVQKLAGADTVDYFGFSHGGHLALRCAELDPQDRVEHILAIDLPAVENRFTVPLQVGYLLVDGFIGKKKYLEAIKGSEIEKDFERFKVEYSEISDDMGSVFIKNNKALVLLNLFMSANARDNSLKSWQKILDRKSAQITVVTAENSSITNPEAIDMFIEKQTPEGKARSRQIVIEGEDHNIGLIHLMPRAVEWARKAYSGTL